MLTRKSLVILAGLLLISALMLFVSWSPATVTAQGPSATPPPPVAVLKVLAIPGNAADPNAITTTIKYISDTTVGPASSTVALYTNGTSNVPVNVPVVLQVSPADPKNTGTATWSLTKPADSKATITGTMTAKFTPDVVGAYYVQVTLKGANGTSAAQFAFFNAGTYIGATAGNCKQCHPTKTAEWAKTGHALVFSEELDNKIDGPAGVQPSGGFITHYSETCTRCHTTGWYPGFTGTGGYFDAKAKANWTFPTWKQIDEVFTKKNPSNWEAAPAEVKNMGNIGCEVCHGPANEHVKNGANVMAVSLDDGVCNQCHAAAANHSKGMQIGFSKHQTGSSFEEINGPAEQACMRCHGAEGFVTFLASPKNPAAWSNEEGAVGCATCHDPHADTNYALLRVVGKPVEVPFANPKDVGLSAICETCHNNRSTGGDAYVKGEAGSGTPHYASDAEMLNDLGGYTYGQTVPNSPHGAMVGIAPVPTGSTTPGTAKFKWSGAADTKGNVPGSCVFCHMQDAITTANDPLQYKVGGHSFNTITPDGKTAYAAACKTCHGDVKTYDMPAKADYDGNGKVEGVQTELKGLLGVLWKQLESKGFVKQQSGYPYATLPKDMTPSLKGAWYNYRYVYGPMWGADSAGNEGKAAAMHNFKRSVALLQLSIKDLAGSLPSGMAEMK